ncbi:SH3 domain-containing protein [Ceratobasidium sp. AG-Ba]|nr:SH3 domain-containing protein [Ceratobasidium sp. AG-Ba]
MFSRLTQEDKLAFFELLDEYFESRPHLLSQGAGVAGNPAASQPAAIAATAVHRTMASNPQATADIISSGLKNIPKSSQYGAASNPIIANAAGRFAASSIASSYGGGSPAQAKSPPAPPKRNIGNNDESSAPDRGSPTGGGLVSRLTMHSYLQRFGDVDTSSVKSMFTSSFKGGKPAPAPVSTPSPPAFSGPKRNFAPPPVRRLPTSSSAENNIGDHTESRPHRSPGEDLAPLRRMPSDHALRNTAAQDPQPAHGERAEALYDYTSDDPGDINVRQGDKLIIVERTSDDWWTGEINGQRGLLPASYVRIL